MDFSKNEVSAFQYSTTMAGTATNIITPLSSAAAGVQKLIKITDLKVTCGGTGRTIKILGQGGSYQALEFDLPADSLTDFHWEMPYRLEAVSTVAGGERGIVASASGAGVKYSISGFYG